MDDETHPIVDKHHQSKSRVLMVVKCWICLSVFGAVMCLLGFMFVGKAQCGTSTATPGSCLNEAQVKSTKCLMLTWVVICLLCIYVLRKMLHHLMEDDQWADARKTLWCYVGLVVFSLVYGYWQGAKVDKKKACRQLACDVVLTGVFTWYVHKYTKEVEQRNC